MRVGFGAALGFVCLMACGSGGSGTQDGGTSGDGGGSCVALTNLCTRLPQSSVESACGMGYTTSTPVDTSGAGPVNSCTWAKNVSTATEHNITVVYRCLQGVDAHQYFQNLVSSNPNGEAVMNVADEAYFFTDAAPFQQGTLHVRQGQRALTLAVHMPDPAPCTPAQAKAHLVAVAQKVLAL